MWGPVNGEKAALGWPSSHLKRAKKKSCGHKDKARQARSCPHIQHLCLFSGSDFPLSTPPLSHLNLLFPLVPLPLPCPSSSVASLRWSFAWVSCHVLLSSVPAKRSASRDTRLALAYWPGPRCLELVLWSAGRADES